jgi:capsular exopolysaccharide synthesis family protein
MTPKEVVMILRRHVLMIVLLTFAGLVVGGVLWFLLLRYFPKYTAETYIRVLAPVEQDPLTIGGAVLQKDIMYGYRASIASMILQQSTLQQLIDRDEIQETEWFRRFGDIRTERYKCIRKAFKDLKKHLSAYADRDREFVTVSMACRNKREAAKIVNQMASLFLASRGEAEKTDVRRKLGALRNQQTQVQRDLEAVQKGLDEIRKETGLTDLLNPEGRQFEHTITRKLNQLEIEKDQLVLGLRQLQASIGTLGRQATGPMTDQIRQLAEADPTLTLLTQQLATLEAQLAGRLSKFGENHRDVRRIQELINETRAKREERREEISNQIRQANLMNAQDALVILSDRMEELERMRREAEERQKDLDAARAQYERQWTIKEERQEMLEVIKAQIESYRIILEDPETPKVEWVGAAPEPLEVSSPRWEFYFPGGTILGILCGVGLAFLIELLNDLLRTPRDVSRYLDIRLLGVIPDSEEDRQVDEIDLAHVVRQAPYSVISESYRRLRTNVELSQPDSTKVIVAASGMGGEGTTTAVVSLAQALVAEDKKVLLIDANFRRPHLQTVFPQPEAGGSEAGRPEFGLSSLLAGLCGSEDVIKANVIDGLDLIESGPLPRNPAELLGSRRMGQMIADYRSKYDYVIIDSPPVLLVSDATVLANQADGALLVFNARTTRRGAAQRMVRELREVNAPIIGCVLMAVRALKGGYFREQFRSYQAYEELQLARST